MGWGERSDGNCCEKWCVDPNPSCSRRNSAGGGGRRAQSTGTLPHLLGPIFMADAWGKEVKVILETSRPLGRERSRNLCSEGGERQSSGALACTVAHVSLFLLPNR